jgi:hypothetical protein
MEIHFQNPFIDNSIFNNVLLLVWFLSRNQNYSYQNYQFNYSQVVTGIQQTCTFANESEFTIESNPKAAASPKDYSLELTHVQTTNDQISHDDIIAYLVNTQINDEQENIKGIQHVSEQEKKNCTSIYHKLNYYEMNKNSAEVETHAINF